MKRLAWTFGLGVLFAVNHAAAEATFDPAVNGLRLGGGALKAYDFESADALVGLELTTWAQGDQGYPTLQRTKIAKPDDVASRLTSAADAVEGAHALRLGTATAGLALTDQALFAQVKDARFQLTVWGRSDGTPPRIDVYYDTDPNSLDQLGAQFASVHAIRTGRETTDGWAEYTTGPLDGNVWGVPVIGVIIAPSMYADAKDAFLIDALEITKVDGKPTAPLACTQQNVDAVCGAEGDCMFGHCVSSSVTWGVLPSAAHRAELAERWIYFSSRLIGDRNAAHHGATVLAPAARDLARTAASSRQFFGGMAHLVNGLRDNHTSFGSPTNFSSFAPQLEFASGSGLGACFGVVEKDIMGGGLGYAVFRASDTTPVSGTQLKRGDVLVSIDGRDPKEWVDDLWPRYATAMPNDAASDWGASANDLSRLITTRATTITIARCASQSACNDGARQLITIDVANALFQALVHPSSSGGSRSFRCSQRFIDSVQASGGGGGGNGEDPVNTAPGTVGETRVQFDGFVGQTTWESSMTSVFQNKPARVLMDARMGHGGYLETVQHLFNLLRGTAEPMGVLSVGRGTYDMTDPPWLFSRLSTCTDQSSNMWTCFEGSATGFFATEASPPGGATKIAWLNTYDVSANDFMPRLLKGRTGIRIFAPHPTSGAFGAITDLPSLAAGWSGGSLQIEDSRFAADATTATSVRWESGHGVEPDQVVVQKLSDALAGVDTLVQAADAWLAAP